ncbi:MAG TPA: hypothetical protein VNR89_07685 [Roseomonas sp.]|nr:hypothetical protein [Roseomonas sp.]
MRRLRELALAAAAAAGLVLGVTATPQAARADEVVLVHDHWRHRPPPPRWHRPPPRYYGYGYGPPPRYYRPPPRVYYPPPPPRYYRPAPAPYYRY